MLLFLFVRIPSFSFFFFFNDTATTEIYTLSLHDALPISVHLCPGDDRLAVFLSRHLRVVADAFQRYYGRDRKSTRLNSSHGYISYAVFCLKKKKRKTLTSTGRTYEYIHASLSVGSVSYHG